MKKCKHELETTTWREDNYKVEYIIKCKKCGAIKEHWSYGVLFYKNWLENPLFEFNIFKRFLYRRFKNYRNFIDKRNCKKSLKNIEVENED